MKAIQVVVTIAILAFIAAVAVDCVSTSIASTAKFNHELDGLKSQTAAHPVKPLKIIASHNHFEVPDDNSLSPI